MKIAEPKNTSEVKKFMEELRAVRNPRKRGENWSLESMQAEEQKEKKIKDVTEPVPEGQEQTNARVPGVPEGYVREDGT